MVNHFHLCTHTAVPQGFFFHPSKELAGFNKNTEKCVEKRTISKAIESRPHTKQMELLAAGSSNIITTRSLRNCCHMSCVVIKVACNAVENTFVALKTCL